MTRDDVLSTLPNAQLVCFLGQKVECHRKAFGLLFNSGGGFAFYPTIKPQLNPFFFKKKNLTFSFSPTLFQSKRFLVSEGLCQTKEKFPRQLPNMQVVVQRRTIRLKPSRSLFVLSPAFYHSQSAAGTNTLFISLGNIKCHHLTFSCVIIKVIQQGEEVWGGTLSKTYSVKNRGKCITFGALRVKQMPAVSSYKKSVI